MRKKKPRTKINNIAQKKWFDKECRIKRHYLRKIASLKHKDPSNIELRNEYHEALKSYKLTLKTKQEIFHNNVIDKLEHASQHDSNTFWKTLKKSTDDLDKENNQKNTPKASEWFTHFQNLHYEHHLSQQEENLISKLKTNEKSKDLLNELDTEINTQEITEAAKKMKLKKAAFSDKINNEIIKNSIDILINGFKKVFNAVLNSGYFPNSWCEGLITPIFKSGDKLNPNNYRGICVSSSLGKFFCSILNNRLIKFLENKHTLHPSQIGFLPGNRTADHIFTLKTLHDKYINQNNEKLYACFIDFKKAFDSVWHEGLYLKLLENGIGGNFYSLIKNLY